jgi:sorbitol-specific phosphotransferase system component IIBC
MPGEKRQRSGSTRIKGFYHGKKTAGFTLDVYRAEELAKHLIDAAQKIRNGVAKRKRGVTVNIDRIHTNKEGDPTTITWIAEDRPKPSISSLILCSEFSMPFEEKTEVLAYYRGTEVA